MKHDKYECDNQMDIFYFLEKQKINAGPPILLDVGQIVYKVIRGDVRELYVYDEKPWLCGENDSERGYRLKEKDGCYDCTWNSNIGVNIFTDKEQAYRVAEAHLNENKCLRKENINPIKTVAYSYVREVDHRTMTAFYSLLDNGMVYIKEFMTYHHICKDANKAIKSFMKEMKGHDNLTEINYNPEFKNMYPCKNDSEWCYAEAKYSHWTL